MNETKARLRGEAAELSGQMREWIERAREQSMQRLPDKERVREEAEQLWGNVGAWVSALPEVVADSLGYEKKRRRSPIGWVAMVGAGAAVMYLLDPQQGAERRKRMMEMVRGWMGNGAVGSSGGGSGGQTENVSLSSAQPGT